MKAITVIHRPLTVRKGLKVLAIGLGWLSSLAFAQPLERSRRRPFALSRKAGRFNGSAFNAQRGRENDLAEERVDSALRHCGVQTLGTPYTFVEAATRTVALHPDPPVYGSLVLANYLDGATAGVREWRVGTRDDEVMGSLTLLKVKPSRALRDASTALVKVVSDLGVDCDVRENKNDLVSEIFTNGGRKVGGLLVETHADHVIRVCFALRMNESSDSVLPLGDTSLRIETGREFPRDAIVADFLAVLERLLPRPG